MSKYNEIFGETWVRILKPFLQSQEWKEILSELKASRALKMYPEVDDIFRAFKLCPYNKLVTVFLTTNPYDVQNDGLAFSTPDRDLFKDHPKVLDCIFDAVEQDVCDRPYLNRHSDLERWAKQGVLLLNCDLTAIKGKPGEHLKLWHPLMKALFTHMGEYNTGITYVLIGQHAQKFSRYINKDLNTVFNIEHPMIAVKEKRLWDHKNIFKEINTISKSLNNQEIDWTKNITWESQS
jgi:uracil-DNA glycosylase